MTPSSTVHGFVNARYVLRERDEKESFVEQDRVDTKFQLNVKGTTNFGSLTLIGDITSEAGPNTGQSLLHVATVENFKQNNSMHRLLNSPYIRKYDCC